MNPSTVIILYGPTASGKSAVGLELALRMDGVIINADSMQAYNGLPILTASPSEKEKSQVPHLLYNYIDPAHSASASSWVQDACSAIKECWEAKKCPILVGGTGLYIKALMQGFSPIPTIAPTVREEVRSLPFEVIRQKLAEADPEISGRLKPGDRQRLTRAYEVFMQTGKSLTFWQSQPAAVPLPEATFALHGLVLPRDVLYARCDNRLISMIKQGGLEELSALLARNLPDSAPLLRAVGVPELTAYLRGEIPLEEALAKAQQATRRYAKRQLTWLRHQFPEARLNAL